MSSDQAGKERSPCGVAHQQGLLRLVTTSEERAPVLAEMIHQNGDKSASFRDQWLAQLELSSRLTDHQKDVAEVLAERIGADGYVYVDHDWLIAETGLSVRTVEEAIKELYGLWWLEPGDPFEVTPIARARVSRSDQ